VIILWAFGMGYVVYKLLDMVHGLRQSSNDEELGSDSLNMGSKLIRSIWKELNK